MRGMPWRMERLQDAVPDAERRLVVEDDHPVLRHREYLAPEPLHVLLEDPRGAGQKLGGIDQVRGADPVDEQARSRETLDQRPLPPGVIEVDVGHYEPGDPVRIEPGGADPGEQRLHGSRRSGLYERQVVPVCQQVGDDGSGHALELVVDQIQIRLELPDHRVAGRLCPVLPGFRWKRGWDRIFGVGRSTPCSLANRPGNGLVKVKPATAGVDHRLRARGNPAPLRKGAPDAVAAPGGTRYGLGGKGGPRVGWR